MDTKAIEQRFRAMAREELDRATSVLPDCPNHRFALFLETARVMDFWSVFQSPARNQRQMPSHHMTLLQWGWNLAVANLFGQVTTSGAIPSMEGSTDPYGAAASLLHQFGRSVLMKRVADMLKCGSMTACSTGQGFVVSAAEHMSLQFSDILESARLESAVQKIAAADGPATEEGWLTSQVGDFPEVRDKPGAFLLQSAPRPYESLILPDSELDAIMIPLIRPWQNGQTTMMAYDARPKVDSHFLALAVELMTDWRSEAGIHPDATIASVKASVITAVATVLTSFHLKHVRFALLALKHYPDISIPASLTIWGPRKALEQSVSDFTGLDHSVVHSCVDAIAAKPSDACQLHKHTMHFAPLLFDLENGLLLKPVSSVASNPLFSISAMNIWRDPRVRDEISRRRENWVRDEIYSMFAGWRYKCIDGSTKLRSGRQTVTDIDAAVLDITTGELALFQIKWQDFVTNDVQALRSKASNLVRELDEWSHKVIGWCEAAGYCELGRCLRMARCEAHSIKSLHLFGVSRSAARMAGFGFATVSPHLAVGNLAHFHRIRLEVGPAPHVFSTLHEKLRAEALARPLSRPMSVTLKVAGTSIRFEGLWNAFADSSDSIDNA